MVKVTRTSKTYMIYSSNTGKKYIASETKYFDTNHALIEHRKIVAPKGCYLELLKDHGRIRKSKLAEYEHRAICFFGNLPGAKELPP